MKRTVLISVIGTSPAVLTEVVYALAHKKTSPVVPDEIVVLTTETGRTALRDALFGQDAGWQRLRTSLQKDGFDIEGRLRFGDTEESIRVMSSADGSRNLDDILTPEDNTQMADTFLRILRGYTDAGDDTYQVYASIAGGRKTMGALLLSCMSLLARTDDHVVDVLVNPPYDNRLTPPFLFPEPKVVHEDQNKRKYSSRKAKVELIDLPFVRMRGLYQEKFQTNQIPSYARLVSMAQTAAPIPDEAPQLVFDFDRGDVFVDNVLLGLTPMQFVVLSTDVVLKWRNSNKPNNQVSLVCDRIAAIKLRLEQQAFSSGPKPQWVMDFAFDISRFKTGVSSDSYRGDMTDIRYDLRRRLSGCSALRPFVKYLIPTRGRFLGEYPKSRITADIRKLKAALGIS